MSEAEIRSEAARHGNFALPRAARYLAAVVCAAMLTHCPAGEPNPGDQGTWSEGGNASDPVFRVTYAPEGFFNQPLPANVEVDPNSSAMIARLASLTATRDNVLMVTQSYSYPVYFADASTPRQDVQLTVEWRPEAGGSQVNLLKDVPIPAGARPDPVPLGPPDWGDGHMAIIDTASGFEYDLWLAEFSGGAWRAAWGNRVSYTGNGVFPGGYSAKGSGFALLAGVIWPEEIAAGHIGHKLFCSLDPDANSNAGPVPPATESDGESPHPAAIPEGAVLQLDPALDLDTLGLTPVEKIVAKAMQEYGLVDGDSNGGGSISIYGVHPFSFRENPYPDLMTEEEAWDGYIYFRNIPIDRMRVLKLPPVQSQEPFLEDESIFE